eukprot:TRINITY_DN4991_c1_g1_i1.p1 TRINITY_DN4991_c1_g1~~TRINITY_DN4991_c1_g1_i1.p1  ORF type:complete len:220 (-),score=-15.91 TRINITY_DN4991_c1_g1_i1:66-725(-)
MPTVVHQWVSHSKPTTFLSNLCCERTHRLILNKRCLTQTVICLINTTGYWKKKSHKKSHQFQMFKSLASRCSVQMNLSEILVKFVGCLLSVGLPKIITHGYPQLKESSPIQPNQKSITYNLLILCHYFLLSRNLQQIPLIQLYKTTQFMVTLQLLIQKVKNYLDRIYYFLENYYYYYYYQQITGIWAEVQQQRHIVNSVFNTISQFFQKLQQNTDILTS